MFKSLLVPVDLTTPEETQRLIRAAGELAGPWGSTLHIVNIVPDLGMPIVGAQFGEGFEKERLKAAHADLDAAVAKAGVAAQTHVLTGTIYDQAIALADKLDSDLILIGAHRPDLKDYLLGSNAARLVRHSGRSVLVLRDQT